MKVQTNIKHSLCALFEAAETENGGWYIVTPMQFNGSNDNIVVHIRPEEAGWTIHDNGDAVMNSNMLGFDADTDAIGRWADELTLYSPAKYSAAEETVSTYTDKEQLLAPYVFRVAEAAQQLFTIATQRQERRASDFKEKVAEIVASVASAMGKNFVSDADLPISGGFVADFLIEQREPLIVIAATSVARLMEAELIFMQYRHQKKPGFVLAIAETPQAVGRKQFDRANYYTGKTVSFDQTHLSELMKEHLM